MTLNWKPRLSNFFSIWLVMLSKPTCDLGNTELAGWADMVDAIATSPRFKCELLACGGGLARHAVHVRGYVEEGGGVDEEIEGM